MKARELLKASWKDNRFLLNENIYPGGKKKLKERKGSILEIWTL